MRISENSFFHLTDEIVVLNLNYLDQVLSVKLDNDPDLIQSLVGKLITFQSRCRKVIVKVGSNKSIQLSKFILNLNPEIGQYSKQVRYKNGDTLDLRKDNLEIVTLGTVFSLAQNSSDFINSYRKKYKFPKHITVSQYKSSPNLVYLEAEITLNGKKFRHRVGLNANDPKFEENLGKHTERGLAFIERIKTRYIPNYQSQRLNV